MAVGLIWAVVLEVAGCGLLPGALYMQYRTEAARAQRQRWTEEWNGAFWAMVHERIENETDHGRD